MPWAKWLGKIISIGQFVKLSKNTSCKPISACCFPKVNVRWPDSAAATGWIRFSTTVRFVKYNEATGQFSVTVHDLKNDHMYEEVFDHVIVASGHFSTPNVPEYPGFSSFGGRVLHAHDFRDAMEFNGKDILLLGSSYSAEDIGSQCWKYGAKSITVAYRNAPMGFDWPENWTIS